MLRRSAIAVAAVLVLLGVTFVFWQNIRPHPENQRAGTFPETLVYVRSTDDVVSAGAVFGPPKETSKPVAIIWIHGWGAHFYAPTYVGIGRALADRGYVSVMGNTRMHDIGNVAKYSWGKRVRGGGYWGVTSDDPELVAQATRLVADGAGEDLLRLPNRSFPSFVSAATFLDIVNTPPEYGDFFGTTITNPAVTRIRCPILAFLGTREPEIGTESDLKLLKSSAQRHASDPSRVDTAMIKNADHEYVGQESQVAVVIAQWADTLLPVNADKVDRAGKQ